MYVYRVAERFKQTVPEYDNKYIFATVGSDRLLMVRMDIMMSTYINVYIHIHIYLRVCLNVHSCGMLAHAPVLDSRYWRLLVCALSSIDLVSTFPLD